MKDNIAALTAGVIFAWGLCVSRMVDPAVVLGFLDVTGAWDPSLAAVMAGALAVTAISYRVILKRKAPVCAQRFDVPQKNELDRPLIIGAALFGVGWGLAGICPGPAIVALSFGLPSSFLFAAAMLAGMKLSGK